MVATEKAIQDSYASADVAANHVRQRFASDLYRLLHDREVAAVQRLIDQVQPERVLEIAPGPGRLTREMRPSGSLICLEYNEGMI
jgi:16S rRNA A1518/A1519 N6-dimethyltransferase RsmA/KsgA/DIM1 with predicted DNA glycosylase/AP lyase activity